MSYVGWLSHKTGKVYRLLTEAEWEYAARAGSTTAYYWGGDIGKGNANCDGCGGKENVRHPAAVGGFKPNPFGVYDVLGNVWQFTEDCWRNKYADAPADELADPAKNPFLADDDEQPVEAGSVERD